MYGMVLPLVNCKKLHQSIQVAKTLHGLTARAAIALAESAVNAPAKLLGFICRGPTMLRLTLASLQRSMLFLMLMACAASPPVLTAQAVSSTLELPIDLNPVSPGSRSMALGGTFTTLVNDPSTVLANPAGLTSVPSSQVLMEVTSRRYAAPFLQRGRLSGEPTGVGIDSIEGPVFGEAVDSRTTPSFIAFTYGNGRSAVGVYRHELVNLHQEAHGEGVFQYYEGGGEGQSPDWRQYPYVTERALAITTYGVAAAHRMGSHLSVGAGLSIFDMSLQASIRSYDFSSFFGPPDFTSERISLAHSGEDVAVSGTLGVLWNAGPLRIGSSFRQGPNLTFIEDDASGEIRFAQMFSVGGMLRASNALTLFVDYVHLGHSRFKRDYVDTQILFLSSDVLAVRDARDVHAGLEYAMSPGRHLSPVVRVGGWYEGDHSVRYERPAPINPVADEALRFVLRPRDGRMHVTVGGGVTLSRRVELSAAVDMASHRRLASATAIFHFSPRIESK